MLILVVALIALTVLLIYSQIKIKKLSSEIEDKKVEFEKERTKIRQDAKKRSGAVQWGKTIEHFIPFTSEFPVPVEDCTFLGMPIDYVAFKDSGSSSKCSIHFIEVKSGNAFLMSKQKNIKKAIEEGRVYWHEISVEGNNVK